METVIQIQVTDEQVATALALFRGLLAAGGLSETTMGAFLEVISDGLALKTAAGLDQAVEGWLCADDEGCGHCKVRSLAAKLRGGATARLHAHLGRLNELAEGGR